MLKITSSGIPETRARIDRLREVVKVAGNAIAEYLLGDTSHGLRHEPPYRTVSHTRAYGEPFSSPRQQHWFFAAKARGEIHPGQDNRTHDLANAWELKETSDTKWTLANNNKAAPFAYGKPLAGQARQLGLVGWRWVGEIVSSNMAGAIRHANAAIKEWLREFGKS
jgi:hypothetical protein